MREWTLTHDGARPLTVNAVMSLHRQQWAKHTRQVREVWAWTARAAHVPQVQRVTIDVTPLHKNRRSPQDVAACAPEAKAAIDGLVDAGVIPDDTPEHLRAVTFHQPRVAGVDGMELRIVEVL